MNRSPFLLGSFLLSVSMVWAQSNPATPQSGSGVPQTPLPGTQSNGPANNPGPASAPGAPAGTNVTPLPPSNTPANTPSAPAENQPANASGKPGAAGTQPAEEPLQPKTEILDSSATSSGAMVTDGHDPILDPPPLPTSTTTLVGGTVTGVDHVRNRMTVSVFGGGKWKIGFDERTHIFRNGAETTQLAIKKGERVYVDTMLDKKNHEIFARNVRVGVAALPADADGQIVEVDSKHQTVTLRDQIDSVPVHFGVDPGTKITHGSSPASLGDLKPGSLVHVKFSPESPNRGLAREIAIVAAPGSQFTFVGKITHLDLHRGVLALQNVLDDKNYEIHFDPGKVGEVRDQLAVGAAVRIVATFEGTRYTAASINMTREGETAEKQ